MAADADAPAPIFRDLIPVSSACFAGSDSFPSASRCLSLGSSRNEETVASEIGAADWSCGIYLPFPIADMISSSREEDDDDDDDEDAFGGAGSPFGAVLAPPVPSKFPFFIATSISDSNR